jgi:hypothetical protein
MLRMSCTVTVPNQYRLPTMNKSFNIELLHRQVLRMYLRKPIAKIISINLKKYEMSFSPAPLFSINNSDHFGSVNLMQQSPV